MFIDVDEVVKAKTVQGGILLSNGLNVVGQPLQLVAVAIGLGFIIIKPFCQIFWHSPGLCQGLSMRMKLERGDLQDNSPTIPVATPTGRLLWPSANDLL